MIYYLELYFVTYSFSCYFQTNKQKWLVESQPRIKVESPKPAQQYFCESCDFSTINKGNLTRHEKNHGAILPHRCNLCDYACCDKHNLANHVSRHHINETGVTGAAMPVKKEKKSSNTNPSYVATGRKVPRRAGHSQKPIRQVILVFKKMEFLCLNFLYFSRLFLMEILVARK